LPGSLRTLVELSAAGAGILDAALPPLDTHGV